MVNGFVINTDLGKGGTFGGSYTRHSLCSLLESDRWNFMFNSEKSHNPIANVNMMMMMMMMLGEADIFFFSWS